MCTKYTKYTKKSIFIILKMWNITNIHNWQIDKKLQLAKKRLPLFGESSIIANCERYLTIIAWAMTYTQGSGVTVGWRAVASALLYYMRKNIIVNIIKKVWYLYIIYVSAGN